MLFFFFLDGAYFYLFYIEFLGATRVLFFIIILVLWLSLSYYILWVGVASGRVFGASVNYHEPLVFCINNRDLCYNLRSRPLCNIASCDSRSWLPLITVRLYPAFNGNLPVGLGGQKKTSHLKLCILQNEKAHSKVPEIPNVLGGSRTLDLLMSDSKNQS